MEEPMAIVDFIIALFYQVDSHLHDIPYHTLGPSWGELADSQAHFWV
jgi:hypothetical protein